jgi:hypothetical protein
LCWEPETKLVRMSFTSAVGKATAEQARMCVEQIDRWTAGKLDKFGMLVDCANIAATDPGWRATLNDYFRSASARVSVAWFNTSPLIKLMTEMFVVGTRAIDGKVCSSESEARAWLRQQVFG